MAFVCRTTREDHDPNPHYKTPAHVGPGAYNTSRGIAKSRPSYAPFGATTKRRLEQTRNLITPGPGRYNSLPPEMTVIGRSSANPGSSFTSQSSRFARRSRSETHTPGPGAYLSSGPWKAKRNAAAARYKNKPNRTLVRSSRRSTAPSIPGPHDHFGYTESSSGNLRKQADPRTVTSGIGRDSPGPADYTPKGGIGSRKKGRGGSLFGKSRIARLVGIPKETLGIPGPGYYAKDSNNKEDKDIYDDEQRKGSSNFASSVTRFTEKAQSDEPGPGTYYDSDEPASSFKKKKVPENLQFFGSTTRRFGGEMAQRTMGRPGPGEYTYKSQFTQRNTRSARSNAVMEISDSDGQPIRLQMSKSVPFAATAPRFKPKKSKTPAPGHALSTTSTSFVKILERKPVSRCTTFGSTTKRFFKRINDVESPGPADYDMKETRSQKPSSNFVSNTQRFRSKKKMQTPDPGAYNVNSKWTTGKRRTGTMQYGTERFSESAPKSDTPGPGKYYRQKKMGNASPNRRNVFGSVEPRFKPKTSKYAIPNPGPGQYNTDNLYGTLNRPTFNMSIAESMYT